MLLVDCRCSPSALCLFSSPQGRTYHTAPSCSADKQAFRKGAERRSRSRESLDCTGTDCNALQVYKAKCDGVTDVAVKFLNLETASHVLSNLRTFTTEIKILRACRSSHITLFMGAWIESVRPDCFFLCDCIPLFKCEYLLLCNTGMVPEWCCWSCLLACEISFWPLVYLDAICMAMLVCTCVNLSMACNHDFGWR